MTLALTTKLAGSTNLQSTLQRLPEMASLLLIVACTYTLANITWELLPENETLTAAPENSGNTRQQKQPASKQLIRQLSNAHMFGVANKKETKVASTTKAPETKLSLILKGVLVATPESISSAIIARKKNGPETVYGIGDKLPGNVIVEEIHADHVILRRGDRLETLRLPKGSSSGVTFTGKAPKINPVTSDPQSLKDLRSHLLKNPTSFADYALPIVVKDEGKQIGYRLDFQEKGDLLKNAGLTSNDVIISINGIKLDSPKRAIRALRKLGTAGQVNLIVRRQGADVPISVQLQ